MIFFEENSTVFLWKANLHEFYENVQELNYDVNGFKTLTQRELSDCSAYCCGHLL
jgi:hypothetical protein